MSKLSIPDLKAQIDTLTIESENMREYFAFREGKLLELLTVASECLLQQSYSTFALAPGRCRSMVERLGAKWYLAEQHNGPQFELIWFKTTEELVALEITKQIGFILPQGIERFERTGRYLPLGKVAYDDLNAIRKLKGGQRVLCSFL